jgi:NitT/TauT family transport system permease protein
MTTRSANSPAGMSRLWGSATGRSSLVYDLPILLAASALFYSLLSMTHYWLSSASEQVEISLHAGALPKYAMYSVLRIALAYGISLVFSVVYGYIAAYNPRAEKFMIPLLDTLQSIPVLSFLPGVMVAMIALFPARQLGIELGSILLIFTGQVWNMAFSFYSSLKAIPREMQEVARIYRWSWWQRFVELELPFSAIGLIWNSMMSVAGGWFFLMACEMFVLGDRDLRLPGLGSYLETAANAGDTRAIVWGLLAMIGIIVLMDQLIWRPVIAWAEKFKFEQVEGTEAPTSPVLALLRKSRILPLFASAILRPIRERMDLHFARGQEGPHRSVERSGFRKWVLRVVLAVAVLGILDLVAKMLLLLRTLTASDLGHLLAGTGATFLRVELTLALAALWTIPVGVAIGLNPRLSAIAQPLAQIAASVPATALFPIIMLALVRLRGGLGVGSIVLLLLGTQWYILFNVIAGAIAIPTDLKEVSNSFYFGRRQRWRELLLPAIFPYLITGLVTASGGAWNASIVAEYIHLKGRTFSTLGLGAIISNATDTGNSAVLLSATIVMAALVVTINRLVWRRLYLLASTKYKLET